MEVFREGPRTVLVRRLQEANYHVKPFFNFDDTIAANSGLFFASRYRSTSAAATARPRCTLPRGRRFRILDSDFEMYQRATFGTSDYVSKKVARLYSSQAEIQAGIQCPRELSHISGTAGGRLCPA